ncbi:CP family cyanate transporter-like MFS transporter [Herbihabitans rhizosphaerae]|uniref:CP family cyanate transporter-like MFS transporter n=1 Tax=Herbihabitans rhizosphaerae TaxID=1872711 RepID=A0A4Q7KZ09_9PSEU|nr:MFS transporter [Herbihabitans rhizosphaerae]RZS41311.1 CP family cyanate transporter-like MFS transporter [Herbihabitans rhizosphaerae]
MRDSAAVSERSLSHGLELELDGATEDIGGRVSAVTGGTLLAVAVVLTAVNLRPAITSVGALLDKARDSLDASTSWAAVLTTIPGLCFAVAGLAAPVLARRIGQTTAIGLALAVLSGGLVLRVLDGPLVVLGGTLAATAGIALANVLVPVVVKSSFPARVGLMTGVYTAALQGGGALGSTFTPPLDDALGGWRQALGAWAVLALVALVVWVFATRRPAGAERAEQPERPGRSLLRSPLAWAVTAFFGLQALLAYVVMGWLPQVLMDAGVTRAGAGLLLGLVSVIAVPISLVVPALAARQGGQSRWIVGLGVFGLSGLLGLIAAPSWSPLLWSIFIGLGMSVFSLVLTVIALRARTAEDTAALSGMAQGFGYLLAAVGPFVFGLLHEASGGWTVPLMMLFGVLVVQMIFGAIAGRDRYV